MIIAALPFPHTNRGEPANKERKTPSVHIYQPLYILNEMRCRSNFTPPLTCIEVGGLTLRLELIYVVQVFTRCSCDVSSIPVVVVTRRDSSRDRNNVHPISSCRKCSRPEERQSTGNDTDGLWCGVVECVSLSQPL